MAVYCVDCPEFKLVYSGTSIMTSPPKFIHSCPNCKREYKYHYVIENK